MIGKLFSLSLKPYVNYVTPLIHSDLAYVSTYFRLRRLRKGRIRPDLERMNWDYMPPKPAFRKSYWYDDFVEDILIGRKVKRTSGE